jgi:hypothetical protein
MLNMQFRLMELLDPYRPWAGIAVAVIGAVLVFMDQTRRQPAAEVTATPSRPVPPPQRRNLLASPENGTHAGVLA